MKTVASSPLSDPLNETPAFFNASCTGLSGLHCMDCFTMKLCNFAAASMTNVTCPKETPYCDSGICVANAPAENCKTPPTTFKCGGSGYYPDPVDCTKYHYCTKETGDAYTANTYHCPKGFIYNLVLNNCIRSAAVCKPFNCKANQMVSHSQYKSFYGYCKSDVPTSDMTVFKCDDTFNMVFNEKTLKCDYQCKAEGYFADSSDPAKFYFCFRDGTVFKYTRETCPKDLVFTNGSCGGGNQIEKDIQTILAKLAAVSASLMSKT